MTLFNDTSLFFQGTLGKKIFDLPDTELILIDGFFPKRILTNLYRDGNDGVAWHSDREHNTGKDPNIASVTFGETRMFKLRHKFRKDIPVVEIPLHHGSFLLMGGTTNSFWQHHVPKTARDVRPRINLTFRKMDRKNVNLVSVTR